VVAITFQIQLAVKLLFILFSIASFIIMSRADHDLQVNLPAGLREAPMFSSKNAAVIQDMVETQEERNPGIKSVLQPGIERKFNTPGTGAPVLDKDTLVPPFVDPAARVPLTSKFSYALGLEQVIQGQSADRNVQDIISANHQLKDGNFVGAQQTLGRDLTEDEINRRQVTPSTGSGTFTYTSSAPSFSKIEADKNRDLYYNGKINELEQAMIRGDSVDQSLANQIYLYFRYRKQDQVDPAIWQRYTEVFASYYRNSGKSNPRKPSDSDKDPFVPSSANDMHQNYNSEEKKRDPFEGLEEQMKQQMGLGIGKIQKGWIKLGKYEFDRSKLHHHNTLSIRYQKNKRKVNGFPNAPVTYAVRDHLMHLTTGEGLPQKLNTAEEHMLHDLFRKSEANIQLQPLGLAKPATSPMISLQTMLAEVNAGNDSHQLKANIERLLSKLQKEGHISTDICSKIRSHYL
jgi:hypothetical protein